MPGDALRPTLLVVDDEPHIVEVIAEFGRRAGFDVISTSSPGEFATLYDDRLDVVILDLCMPGVDGVELLRQLAMRGSRARIILVSGVDERVLDAARQLGVSQGLNIVGSLQKPVRLATLTKLLDASVPSVPQAASRAFEVTRAQLQEAFDEDRLLVHFQPQVSVRTGEVIGVEALVRWHDPATGLIPPEMFVEVAEAAGLALPLTWRVIEKTAQHAIAFSTPWNLSVSVNLPPAALTDIAFPDAVIEHLAGTPLTPARVTFEVTETSVAAEPVAALDILTRLRLKGFSLAIDDFGTGYSSLEQLRRMPFSELKIDKTFVRRMDRDPASRAIVEHCVLLGHDLGLTVVAEGAETPEAWRALTDIGCDVIQGFFVMRPAPAEEVAAWLPSWASPR
jgi:EAL domain-containing protein (putative c-di-GMP-specific phosphodiesterase class I)/ActR/RegA family two-component response regulator